VSLAAIVLEVDNQTISITSSLGVAELHRNEDAASWLRRVDEALYQAKTAGRNQVVAAT
jgi:diguanylate cyclase (GGDEF)-like protein